MERLWAPWRMRYIDSARGDQEPACIFCDLPATGDDEAAHIVARGDHAFAVLNAYPYNSGHLMVSPFRHVGSPEDLEDREVLDTQRLLGRAVRALRKAMSPEGFNIGMNLGQVAGAGIPDHVHWHVVPRWSGDTNFMPVVGETKVLPELLAESYAKVKAAFPEGP
jgi:ATP adenylyltransferase